MSELQVRNRELQDSIENLKRTRSAKERMESELNIGRDIQMSMLPVEFPAFPNRHEFDIYATLYPAREVGGDFYDFFLIDEDKLCFCVGDVSGKGVPSALFMAVTKTLIKSRASNDSSPASILTHVNEELGRHNESCMFVTIWLGILDVKSGRIAYTNAGHNPPYLKRADGRLERLAKRHGPVVGAMDGMVYREDELTVGPRDLVVLYTDGVTEAMDPAQSLYEEQRLVNALSARAFTSVEDAAKATVDDVWRFQAEADQADDITVLTVEFHGAPKGTDLEPLEFSIVNQLVEIDKANQAFSRFAQAHGLPAKARRSVNLVLDELLNNIITYAYDESGDRQIGVRVELTADRLAITVTDDGKPFNPFGQAAPDTGLGLEERSVGGLGIHLVRKVMDETTYHRRTDRNVVILVKYLQSLSAPEG
jgi:sigma-B regulation protein RsbU (phosphoserine phosphatase)